MTNWTVEASALILPARFCAPWQTLRATSARLAAKSAADDV
jgi:hypothetical protein